MVNLKIGYPATCEVCGETRPLCLECRSDKRSPVQPGPDRFLELFHAVAETLADREAKYGGVYEEMRMKYDVELFFWEVERKLRRYQCCLKNGESDAAKDCLIDIAGYCVLEMELLRGQKEFRKEG
jgi:hypothetical protein